jgi:hypothetical protein
MITGDEKKWAESTDEQLRDIAKMWAKKFTHKELRAFQQAYVNYQEHPELTEDQHLAYDNMWQVATWAIGFRAFGED